MGTARYARDSEMRRAKCLHKINVWNSDVVIKKLATSKQGASYIVESRMKCMVYESVRYKFLFVRNCVERTISVEPTFSEMLQQFQA